MLILARDGKILAYDITHVEGWLSFILWVAMMEYEFEDAQAQQHVEGR